MHTPQPLNIAPAATPRGLDGGSMLAHDIRMQPRCFGMALLALALLIVGLSIAATQSPSKSPWHLAMHSALVASVMMLAVHLMILRATARKLALRVDELEKLGERHMSSIRGSATKDAAQRTEQSELLLKTIVDVLPQRVFWKDREGRFLGANRAFREDVSVEDIVGKTDYEIPWRTGQEEFFRNRDLEIMASRRPILHRVEEVVDASGSSRWLTTCQVPLLDANGESWGLLGTYEDVTAIKQTEAKLIRATDDAEAANRAKSEFLAVISHEIRTPMNGIVGFAELLFGTSLTEEQNEFVHTIRESAAALTSVINDILDFSSIEAGRMNVARTAFDAYAVTRDAMNLLRPLAAQKHLDFKVEWPLGIARNLYADPGRFRQVLLNLAGNGVKFTSEGTVTVKASQGPGDTVRIQVEDSGIGMTEAQITKLFNKFTQVDSSDTRKYGGTGLGLAIAKQLVALMGGRIGVTSVPGKGSVFWFTLPAAPCNPKLGEAANEVRILDTGKLSTLRPLRILVVEDNPVNSLLAQRLLKRLGCTVDIAENGRIACERTAASRYDLVLMDCQMPEVDGFEATKLIRERELQTGSHIPIVALTANVMATDRDRCLAAGMDDYLPKPFTASDFERTLGRWCAA